MQNFGETLTYWYLRLNGFFPLPDLVVHGRHHADTDLLAVRLPFVYEDVGGREEDLDLRFRRSWGDQDGMELPGRTVGLIVQVKTGEIKPAQVRQAVSRAFSENRLKHAVQRLGLLPPYEAARRGGELSGLRYIEFSLPGQESQGVIAKVLVTEEERRKQRGARYFGWNLVQMSEFVLSRLAWKEKSGARLFFANDLIQYLAWMGKRSRQQSRYAASSGRGRIRRQDSRDKKPGT